MSTWNILNITITITIYHTITRINRKGPVGKRRKIGRDTFSQFSVILLIRKCVINEKIYISVLRISSMLFINASATFMSNVIRKSVYLWLKTLKNWNFPENHQTTLTKYENQPKAWKTMELPWPWKPIANKKNIWLTWKLTFLRKWSAKTIYNWILLAMPTLTCKQLIGNTSRDTSQTKPLTLTSTIHISPS